jgi:hypothetical protein
MMPTTESSKPTLVRDGFEIVPSVLDRERIEELRGALSGLKISPGHRNLTKSVPAIAQLAESSGMTSLLASRVSTRCFVIRSIFFDKAPGANWLVPWHQDLSIAVKERVELPGYGPWSTKDGVLHVQPPVRVLESMVTLRLHLDDCDASNGALRVIPGSHAQGRLSASCIAEMRRQNEEVTISVRAGDALIMKPLLLHASPEASFPRHRRVIHFEFASSELEPGLEWAESL